MSLLRRLATPLLIVLTLAAGCASQPAPPRRWAETATRELNLALSGFELQGRRVTVTRSNAAAGPLPVVVYLPGLGQGSDSGQRWAAAWAQAGYAVLSVQPLEADAAAWRSELARTGEFRELGLLHYGDALRADRLAALRRLLPALRAAQPTLDWSRAALAGFETGAQTAIDARGDAGWLAVIGISPPGMQAPANGAATLLITSDIDHDPLGLLRSPAQRRQAFDSLPPGSGWLLNLGGVPHAALAGTLAPDGWHEQDQRHTRAGGGIGRSRGGDGPQGPAGGGGRGPRSGSATEAAQIDVGEGLRLSRAFLDAQLRGMPLVAGASLQAR
jgi:dienelactone hydrolase